MQQRIELLERRLARERAARHEAEALLEGKARALWEKNRELQAQAESQEALIASRTEELRRARDEAVAASSAKSAFLANMSHEIRTPLTSIIGFGELLLEGRSELVDPQEALQTIVHQGRHLLEIINDILDLSKIETESVELEEIEVSLPALLREVQALAGLRAREKELLFEVKALTPVPARLRADPVRIKQILLNFCSNAVRFTEQGAVRVLVSHDAAAAQLRISVNDTGIGMTPEQCARLFRPFTQADASTTRRFGGTGLGLHISRELALLMQGRIELSSEPGQGSSFTLVLPVRDAGPLLAPAAFALLDSSGRGAAPVRIEVPALTGRVLLAEDGIDNQRLLSLFLRRAGLEVDIADNGRAAVEAAMATDYDLVLMDVQMPEMDGMAATALLKTAGCPTPVVALTANVMKHDVQRYLGVGCVDVLAKPVERQRFYAVVAQHLRKPPARLSADDEMELELQALFAEFRRELPQRLAEIEAALAGGEGQRELLVRLVHTLKGSAGSYGHPELTHICAEIEAALRTGDDAVAQLCCETLRATVQEALRQED
ncbi:ATP-binding protein [Azohydromonas aeria]|uniref:ATP-binding protein n=1 Tax=Azohydromonas aeria TaxID=2590212 RepID=UPI0012F82863|nr:ATP-binding protein [Azohydromonas aeria]